ncbi:MAG: hypothetical protein IPL46_02545 [Saprospiraceae bacterium]|nr:hypothetical protein [Saprospiraceae bacterium]
MKIEFNNCAKAIRWILLHTRTELDFQNMREQLDVNYLYSGMFFVYASKELS